MLADNVISLVSLFFYKQTKIKKTIKEEEKWIETKQEPRKLTFSTLHLFKLLVRKRDNNNITESVSTSYKPTTLQYI